jgi:polyhydroxyalkanoate synthesis regulator phasin
MKTLSDLINSPDPIINSVATSANGIEQQVAAGKLTPIEGKELIEDLMDLTKLQSLAADIDRHAEITKAFNLLRELISFIPL